MRVNAILHGPARHGAGWIASSGGKVYTSRIPVVVGVTALMVFVATGLAPRTADVSSAASQQTTSRVVRKSTRTSRASLRGARTAGTASLQTRTPP